MGVTNFIWDELSDNILMETDKNDLPTVVYTHEPGRFGKLISQKRDGVTSYYHYDGEHSTRMLTDENQNITDTYIYSAFGELVARTGTTTNPFCYKGAVGYYTNSATNDIYVRARTYEPVTGRWLSMDPLGFVDGPNLYRAYFVPGDKDPDGLSTLAQDPAGVRTGNCCAIPLFNYGGVVPDPWKREAGIACPNVLESGGASQQDILRFIMERQCCTVYLIGHRGGVGRGTTNGGAVTYPLPTSTVKNPTVIFPDLVFERILRFAFVLNNCGGKCVINLVTCGSSTEEERITRQLIANRTGCLVCASTETCNPGDSGVEAHACTLGEPVNLEGACVKRWPYSCVAPEWRKWEFECVEWEWMLSNHPLCPIPFKGCVRWEWVFHGEYRSGGAGSGAATGNW